MHQNPPFSGKNSNVFWGGSQTPPPRPSAPSHYEILDPLLVVDAVALTVHRQAALLESPEAKSNQPRLGQYYDTMKPSSKL